MNLVRIHQYQEVYGAPEDFLQLYFSSGMKYLASDLLEKGFSPVSISKALSRAMTVAKVGGIDLRKHFCPVYTQVNEGLFSDCKLSKLGFALLVINADASLPAVADLQLEVLQYFFEG